MDEQQLRTSITELKTYWYQRNVKFKEWYETLIMVDTLYKKGLESYVSNEPQTFYDMAHYLLTRGDLFHYSPMSTESMIEMDRRAKIDRGCQYMWRQIDNERREGGNYSFLDELAFFILVLGWYSTIFQFDRETGLLKAQVWNPYDTYPYFGNGQLMSCLHNYQVTEGEAKLKAEQNGWEYKSNLPSVGIGGNTANVTIDDFWVFHEGEWWNSILFNGNVVDDWTLREDVKLLVSPIAGFPDKGSLTPGKRDWRKLTGRSIFEVNEQVTLAFNKWKTMISQILRDTAQPVTQEFSQSPQATPEQLRERGALFHYAPGEQGIQRLPPAAIPIELQAHMIEIRRELQKGGFNDAVWGMLEKQPGYALSMMASSSANQILYPYMDTKHFVIGSGDSFWLSKLKTSKKVFEIKGKLIEKLKPTDIPDDVNIIVESDVATPKDYLERGTIANYFGDFMDKATILGEIVGMRDPQAILRKKKLQDIMDSPEALALQKISAFRAHATYLEFHGDREQAKSFRKMADALEAQMGTPAPGQAATPEMSRVEAERAAGAPSKKPSVASKVAPPESMGGFSPQELRNRLGRGKVIRG